MHLKQNKSYGGNLDNTALLIGEATYNFGRAPRLTSSIAYRTSQTTYAIKSIAYKAMTSLDDTSD